MLNLNSVISNSVKMVKKLYVLVSKPIQFKEFEISSQPMGWIRIDILKKKINEDENYRNKFSDEELKIIDEK